MTSLRRRIRLRSGPDEGRPPTLAKGEILSVVKVERDRYRARLVQGIKGAIRRLDQSVRRTGLGDRLSRS